MGKLLRSGFAGVLALPNEPIRFEFRSDPGLSVCDAPTDHPCADPNAVAAGKHGFTGFTSSGTKDSPFAG